MQACSQESSRPRCTPHKARQNVPAQSMFQAMGNTMPSLMANATRILTFALPATWLTTLSSFELRHLWFLSVGTVALQACVSWWMLTGEFRKRLGGAPAREAVPSQA